MADAVVGEGEGGGGRYHYGIPVRGLPIDYVHIVC